MFFPEVLEPRLEPPTLWTLPSFQHEVDTPSANMYSFMGALKLGGSDVVPVAAVQALANHIHQCVVKSVT